MAFNEGWEREEMISANDNTPTQVWLDLVAYTELYETLLAEFPVQIAHVKAGGGINREQSAANFIWFMRFELECRESDIEERREGMKVIE